MPKASIGVKYNVTQFNTEWIKYLEREHNFGGVTIPNLCPWRGEMT